MTAVGAVADGGEHRSVAVGARWLLVAGIRWRRLARWQRMEDARWLLEAGIRDGGWRGG